MDTISYVALTRQSGLLKEMQMVANNLANMSTTGYRAEGVVFAEMVTALPAEGGSIAMTSARVRYTSEAQGALQQTGGKFDLGIQGEGFFQIQTPAGIALTRAGAFTPNEENDLVTMDGHPVLDVAGGTIFIPPDARSISVGTDGTLTVDGQIMTQIGVVSIRDEDDLTRDASGTFMADEAFQPVENPKVMQGFLEQSNVDPVREITRMIEVQRAYELGQKLLDRDDERIRQVIRTIGAPR